MPCRWPHVFFLLRWVCRLFRVSQLFTYAKIPPEISTMQFSSLKLHSELCSFIRIFLQSHPLSASLLEFLAFRGIVSPFGRLFCHSRGLSFSCGWYLRGSSTLSCYGEPPQFVTGRINVAFLAELKTLRVGIAVGTAIADRPPHRSVREVLPHTAPAASRARNRSFG